MEAKVSWQSGMHFKGVSESGRSVDMDAAPEHGGRNKGPKPMETLLMSLGGCASMDVTSLFKKMRQDVTALEVKLTAERAEQHPKIFTRVHMTYEVAGDKLDAKMIEKAVKMTHDRYCPVSAMFSRSGEVSYSITLTQKVSAAQER